MKQYIPGKYIPAGPPERQQLELWLISVLEEYDKYGEVATITDRGADACPLSVALLNTPEGTALAKRLVKENYAGL